MIDQLNNYRTRINVQLLFSHFYFIFLTQKHLKEAEERSLFVSEKEEGKLVSTSLAISTATSLAHSGV